VREEIEQLLSAIEERLAAMAGKWATFLDEELPDGQESLRTLRVRAVELGKRLAGSPKAGAAELEKIKSEAQQIEAAVAALEKEIGEYADRYAEHGALVSTLRPLFETAIRTKQYLSVPTVRGYLDDATPAQRAFAAQHASFLDLACRATSDPPKRVMVTTDRTNGFPEVAAMLRVRQPTVRPLPTPAAVDEAIRAQLGSYIQRQIGWNVRVEANLVTLASHLFAFALVKWEPPSPQSGPKDVHGFTQDGVIYLNASTATAGTLVHEGIHLYSDDRFKNNTGRFADEGVTEYFARKVINTMPIDRTRTVYPAEFAAASAIIETLSEGAVADFYFKGDESAIRTGLSLVGTMRFEDFCKGWTEEGWEATLRTLTGTRD
jgi:hypothetical protein